MPQTSATAIHPMEQLPRPWRVHKVRRAIPGSVIPVLGIFFAAASLLHAALPPGYLGKPFDDLTYRSEEAAESSRPKSPYHAFAPVLTLWNSHEPKGSGWVGNETPQATIGLDLPGTEEKRLIHYHVTLGNYRYAAFGWRWASPEEMALDLSQYDAVSFSIRVYGSKLPQELFFSGDQFQFLPISLRAYDPALLDGAWHKITIPTRSLKWNVSPGPVHEVRGFTFCTFVWDPADFDIQLDQLAAERATALHRPESHLNRNDPPTTTATPQAIPGRVECAFYDLGGEGVSYHDTTPMNALSGVLNQQLRHQRSHATAYEWNFRPDEGVDISFTKDWADLNHTNFYDIPPNQLYIGCTEDGEWCRYTVDVKQTGKYKIIAAYANDDHGLTFSLSLDNQPAAVCKVPLVTGSMHKWNKAEVGEIQFPAAGTHLLTLHYGRGFNLAYFEFDKVP